MPFLYEQLGWRYNQTPGSSFTIAKYKNDTSYPRVLQTVTMNLGTGANGVRFTAGDDVTGDGDAYKIQLKCTGSDGTTRSTQTVTVSKTVGRTWTEGYGYTPTLSQTQAYTFTFTTPVYVKNGETVNIIAHISDKTSSCVIVAIDINNSYLTGTTARGSVVKIYNGSSWINAVPHVYDGSKWVPATAYVYKNSTDGWKICVP